MRGRKPGNRKNFTKGNIDALPIPETGCVTYRDTEVRGLVLRCYASGVKTYFLNRNINGVSEFVGLLTGTENEMTPSRYPEMTPEQARRHAQRLIGMIAEGKTNPAEAKRKIRAEMTLGQLFERYIQNHAKRHKKTWKYDEQMFENYFSEWKNRKISSITRREVQALHGKMGDDNGPYQANRAFAMFRTVYEKAREWGYEGDNPCFKLKKFKEESRSRRLDAEECESFFKAVMEEKNEVERDFLLMLLYTAARKSNVLSMKWENISLDMKVWNIPAAESKNGFAYTVPLISYALEILTRRKTDKSPWVFPSTEGKTGHLQDPNKAWMRLLKASKLKDLRLHDLRRSAATWMVATGSSAMLADYALGHKLASQGITGVYAREDLEAIRAGMERAIRAMLRKGKVIPEGEGIIEYRQSV